MISGGPGPFVFTAASGVFLQSSNRQKGAKFREKRGGRWGSKIGSFGASTNSKQEQVNETWVKAPH